MTAERWDFEAIGTSWRIDTEQAIDRETRDAVLRVVDDFDRAWSRFRDDSMIARLARGAGSEASPPDAVAMLDLLGDVADSTGGAVNPLVGASLAALGYDADYTLAGGIPVAAPSDWRDLVRWDDRRVVLERPATIDVGALGKGRLVDLVLDVVRTRLDGAIVVDASGDLAIHGTTERIGLEHPYDSRRAIGVWEVADAALCASATNRRRWGDGLHHVLDARTGEPVPTVAATWAVAETAMLADAAATALFFDGGPEFAHDRGVAWVRMLTDGRVETSPGSPAQLFVRKAGAPA